MFRCDRCGKSTKSGEPQHRVVSKRRERTYQEGQTTYRGWEIEQEESLCAKCYAAEVQPE